MPSPQKPSCTLRLSCHGNCCTTCPARPTGRYTGSCSWKRLKVRKKTWLGSVLVFFLDTFFSLVVRGWFCVGFLFRHFLLIGCGGLWRQIAVFRHFLLTGCGGLWRQIAVFRHFLLIGCGGLWSQIAVFRHFLLIGYGGRGAGLRSQIAVFRHFLLIGCRGPVKSDCSV